MDTRSGRARRDAQIDLFEHAADVVFLHDTAGGLISVNAMAERVTGYTRDELVEMDLRSLLAPGSIERAGQAAERIRSGQPVLYEIDIVAKDGRTLTLEISSRLVSGAGGRPLAVQGIARDVTDRKRREAQLHHMALHDALTGLPNRSLWEDRLARALAAGKRRAEPVALLVLDFDDFKGINDSFGHQVGDLVLREAAPRLLEALRETDTVARIGGDEFAAVLPATGADGAIEAARRILRMFERPIRLGGILAKTSVSIGVSVFPADALRAEELVERADLAMYEAKRARSGFAVYGSEPSVTPFPSRRGSSRSPEARALQARPTNRRDQTRVIRRTAVVEQPPAPRSRAHFRAVSAVVAAALLIGSGMAVLAAGARGDFSSPARPAAGETRGDAPGTTPSATTLSTLAAEVDSLIAGDLGDLSQGGPSIGDLRLKIEELLRSAPPELARRLRALLAALVTFERELEETAPANASEPPQETEPAEPPAEPQRDPPPAEVPTAPQGIPAAPAP